MRHEDFTGSTNAHRECWELLPWVANERATANDLARIETHLRDCGACQEELELQRRLRDVVRSQDAIVLAPQTSLHKLMQRIDGLDEAATDDDSTQSSETPIASPAPRAGTRGRQWLGVAAAVQGVAIAALLTALWWQSRELLTAPRYTTLTTHTVARGPVIRIVFAEEVSLEEISDLLRSVNAQIVAGPSEAGVYTLGVTVEAARATDLDETLKRLRTDERVIFAEAAVVRAESP